MMPVVIAFKFVVARDKPITQRRIVDDFVFLKWGRSTRIAGRSGLKCGSKSLRTRRLRLVRTVRGERSGRWADRVVVLPHGVDEAAG